MQIHIQMQTSQRNNYVPTLTNVPVKNQKVLNKENVSTHINANLTKKNNYVNTHINAVKEFKILKI